MGRKYTVAAGEHEVKLSEPRYEDLVTKVTIVPTNSRPVYVNGRFMGHADEFNNPAQGLKLNPGEYTVRVVPVGSEQGHEEKVKIEADKVTIVRSGK